MANIRKKKISPMRVVFILAFIAVPTIHFLVTYVYVNLNSFTLAFYRTVGGEKQWGFMNFVQFFEEFGKSTSEIVLAFENTFKTFLIQTILFPVGIMVSYFLYKKILFHRFFRLTFFMPMIISSVVLVAVYKGIISPEGGLAKMLQKLLNRDTVPEILSDYELANWGIWLLLIWTNLPGNMILWGGTFSRIPDSVLESAKLDGITWGRELVSIILPLVWPTFIMMLMLHCSAIFSASGNVFLLTQGKFDTQTFSNWMYMQVYNATGATSNAFNYMSAVGLMVTLVACVIAVAVQKLKSKFAEVDY